MFKKSIAILSFTLLILLPSHFFAQDIPARPNPPRLVNDLADLLDAREVQALETKLRYFNDTTSNQIVIVTINSLNGLTPHMFANEIGEQWGVGQQKFDNGIVILVKPKTSQRDEGQVWIEIGYGLEPVITDALAKRIVENQMLPPFRQGNFYQGFDSSTDILMALAAGEITEEGYNEQSEGSPLTALLPIIIFILIFLIIRGSRGRSSTMGGRSNVPFWTALWLGSSLGGGRSHSGSWGNFSGGSGGFGGGGGFGGFGGGSFGGGGAGGSW